jgi:AcrR family transcriptional regulator
MSQENPTVTSSSPRRGVQSAPGARLLRAAQELLAEGRVFSRLTVAEIAERAGCSRTSFYFEFAGTRDLLVRLAVEAAPEIERRLECGSLDTVVDVLVEWAPLVEPLLAEAQRSEQVAEAADRLLGPVAECALDELPAYLSNDREGARACIDLLLRIPHSAGSTAALRLLWRRVLLLEEDVVAI